LEILRVRLRPHLLRPHQLLHLHRLLHLLLHLHPRQLLHQHQRLHLHLHLRRHRLLWHQVLKPQCCRLLCANLFLKTV
jgi:hypothetical protein